jgi:hypothetical protein
MNASMPIAKRTWMSLLLLALGVVTLLGCGSGGTKTISVSSATPSGTATKRAPTQSTLPSSPSKTTTTTGASTTGGVEATRTNTAPAFTKEAGGSEGLGGAVAVVKALGFTPNNTSDYRADQTLRVLTATRTGSGDGYAQQVFFFVGNRYIGTDTSQPSAGVKVVAQSDTEVKLAYPLYRPHDPLCCPGGGQATVRFQLNNGRLVPLGTIPPSSSTTGLSRG